MKNICIFAANYLPNIGGIERYTYYISKELINRGYNVTIVTNDVFHLGEKEVTEHGATLLRFPCRNFLNARFPVYKKNKAFKRIDKYLNSQDFDLVIINARFYIHSLYAAKFAQKKNIPFFTIEHGCSHLSVNNKILDYFGGLLEHFITYLLKKRCKDFYGVSNLACNWSGHFKIKSKGTLYNCVDPDEIQELLNNKVCDYKKEFNIPIDSKIVTFTGRIIPEKGIFELVEAFNKLNDKNVHLIIAGDGAYLNEVKSICGSNVHFTGHIDFNHVISLLDDTDIFCLPSVSEGMSTSVLEAACAKCYVITTKNGGAVELITSSNLGSIIDDNSPDKIFTALKYAIQNPDKIKETAENCHQALIKKFTWKNNVDKIEAIIAQEKGKK